METTCPGSAPMVSEGETITSCLIRWSSGTTKRMPRSLTSRPTRLRFACSNTSRMTASGRPRRSVPTMRALTRSPCIAFSISLGEANTSSPPVSGRIKPKPSRWPIRRPEKLLGWGAEAVRFDNYSIPAKVRGSPAQMAELVDALGSGPSGGNTVEVRVLFWAPSHWKG